MFSADIRYKVMRLLEANSGMTAARKLGVSLGKPYYGLQALLRKVLLKASSLRNSRRKPAYMYLLKPRGIEKMAKLTFVVQQIKIREYKSLHAQIEQIGRDVER